MAFITSRTPIDEINAEIKRNTRPVKNFLPWQLAEFNNNKPKRVIRKKALTDTIILGLIK
jgi:hypothetical protein